MCFQVTELPQIHANYAIDKHDEDKAKGIEQIYGKNYLWLFK